MLPLVIKRRGQTPPVSFGSPIARKGSDPSARLGGRRGFDVG